MRDAASPPAPRAVAWLARHPGPSLALGAMVFLAVLGGSLRIAVPVLQKPLEQYIEPADVPQGSMLNPLVHHDLIPNSVFLRNPSRFDTFRPSTNRINA